MNIFKRILCRQEKDLKAIGLIILAQYANQWWNYKGESLKRVFEKIEF